MWMTNSFPSRLLKVTGWFFCTRPSYRMLAIPLGLYHTGSEYPGRSPILLVCVTLAIKWTFIYCPSGASLILERYFLLINALHVDWFPRRHQFQSIPASAASARMVSPTFIMLTSPYLTLFLIGSVCWTSWVEVWQNTRPGDGILTHFLVGYPIMILHKASLMFTNALCSPPPGGLLEYFSCFIFLNSYAYSLSLVWVGESLFPSQWPFSP